MRETVKLEFFKMGGRHLWLLPLFCLLLQGAWMWQCTKGMSHLDIVQGWQYYLYRLPTLNAVLLPVLLAVLASASAAVEHKGQMLRQLSLVQPSGGILAAKLIYGGWHLIWLLAGQLFTMLLIGLYKGFYGPIPWNYFGRYLLFTFLISFCIYLVQLLFSLLLYNQAVSMLIGIAGSFLGLGKFFFQQQLFSPFILWTYYSKLLVCGIHWDKESQKTEMIWTALNWEAAVFLSLGLVLTLLAGWWLLERKEY